LAEWWGVGKGKKEDAKRSSAPFWSPIWGRGQGGGPLTKQKGQGREGKGPQRLGRKPNEWINQLWLEGSSRKK